MSLQPLLQQFARAYGPSAVPGASSGAPATDEATLTVLRHLVATQPEPLVTSLIAEAADSDDVNSAQSAHDYAAARLDDMSAIVPPGLAADILNQFDEKTREWGRAPL